jgi:hypothetical protein
MMPIALPVLLLRPVSGADTSSIRIVARRRF